MGIHEYFVWFPALLMAWPRVSECRIKQHQHKSRGNTYEHSRSSRPTINIVTTEPFDTVVARIDAQKAANRRDLNVKEDL